MKKNFKVFILLALFLNCAPLAAETGDGAASSTHDATILSIMGWGAGLAVGIALLCGYLEQETSHTH